MFHGVCFFVLLHLCPVHEVNAPMGIFMNPAGNSEGFDEKENPDGRRVNDYVITRAWGDNPFFKLLRPGQVKIWKTSVVWYEYFLELPIGHF